MKQADIVSGGVYTAKVSGWLCHVRVDAIDEDRLSRTCYHCTNLSTGRKLFFRSAMKFRMPVKQNISALP